MNSARIDAIVRELVEHGGVDGLTSDEASYVLANLDRFQEWVDNEHRIAELQTELAKVNALRNTLRAAVLMLAPESTPAPSEEAMTTNPNTAQQIQSWTIPNSAGRFDVTMPPDADVFHVEAVGDQVILSATVSVFVAVGPDTAHAHGNVMSRESRTFVLLREGAILPAAEFPATGYAKTYLGSVSSTAPGPAAGPPLHIWQIAPRASLVELSVEERLKTAERMIERLLAAVPSAGIPSEEALARIRT